jgi:hypothetical protein
VVRIFGLAIDRYREHSVSVYMDGKLAKEWYLDSFKDADTLAEVLTASYIVAGVKGVELLLDGKYYEWRKKR